VPAAASHFSQAAFASGQAEGAAMSFFTSSVSVFLISSVIRIILSFNQWIYLLYAQGKGTNSHVLYLIARKDDAVGDVPTLPMPSKIRANIGFT
jgi:hypothetical protein